MACHFCILFICRSVCLFVCLFAHIVWITGASPLWHFLLFLCFWCLFSECMSLLSYSVSVGIHVSFMFGWMFFFFCLLVFFYCLHLVRSTSLFPVYLLSCPSRASILAPSTNVWNSPENSSMKKCWALLPPPSYDGAPIAFNIRPACQPINWSPFIANHSMLLNKVDPR